MRSRRMSRPRRLRQHRPRRRQSPSSYRRCSRSRSTQRRCMPFRSNSLRPRRTSRRSSSSSTSSCPRSTTSRSSPMAATRKRETIVGLKYLNGEGRRGERSRSRQMAGARGGSRRAGRAISPRHALRARHGRARRRRRKRRTGIWRSAMQGNRKAMHNSPSPMPKARASRRIRPKPRAGSPRPPRSASSIRSSISPCSTSAAPACRRA